MSLLSSHNVVYGFLVAPNTPNEDGEVDELVIDSNDRARELIMKQEKAYKAKLLDEERERRLAEMRESGAEIPEGMDPDEFLGLADSIMEDSDEEAYHLSGQRDIFHSCPAACCGDGKEHTGAKICVSEFGDSLHLHYGGLL